MSKRYESADPRKLHDMRQCLVWGRTPASAVYTDPKDVAAADEALTSKAARVINMLLGDGQEHDRAMTISFEETLGEIYSFAQFSFDLGANPLPVLRVGFPDWKWDYVASEENVSPILQGANYIFFFGGCSVAVSASGCKHRFICSYLDEETFRHCAELPQEGFVIIEPK